MLEIWNMTSTLWVSLPDSPLSRARASLGWSALHQQTMWACKVVQKAKLLGLILERFSKMLCRRMADEPGHSREVSWKIPFTWLIRLQPCVAIAASRIRWVRTNKSKCVSPINLKRAAINQCLIVCGWNRKLSFDVCLWMEILLRVLIMERNLEMENSLASAVCSAYEMKTMFRHQKRSKNTGTKTKNTKTWFIILIEGNKLQSRGWTVKDFWSA